MIDRELLWKAWPEGYLAMRGVQTVEGWLFSSNCLIFSEYGLHKRHVSPRSSCIVHAHGTNNSKVQGWIDAGDLLPNVDPDDSATWSCLLRDLASGVSLHGFARQYMLYQSSTGVWCLEVSGEKPGGINHRLYKRFCGIHTHDPALALVLARIQLRETS